ncbi:hypothetical protein [Enterococcus raffinosus]|uniref:hypothetical protein n=1 Tax=Enterococcus raffinosus TaxID=71452 RepID=UPI003AC60693
MYRIVGNSWQMSLISGIKEDRLQGEDRLKQSISRLIKYEKDLIQRIDKENKDYLEFLAEKKVSELDSDE